MDDISINTIIGEGSSYTGDMQVSGCLRIDGDIKGDIDCSSKVFINEQARVKGDVRASSVSIGGVVHGNVIASGKVYLFSSAIIFGDIISKGLQTEEDAFVNGRCVSIENEQNYQEILGRWKDMKIVKKASYKTAEA